MFCTNCGTKINDGDSFCTNCGAKISLNITENSNKNIDLATQISNAKCVTEYSENTTIDEIDTVLFGEYSYSKDGEKQPIEWIVLEKKQDKAFLISKLILYVKEYGIYNDYRVDFPCWENSFIREWLNGTFYQKAFNVKERELIETTIVNSVAYVINKYEEKNVEDKLFLLSFEEINKYFNQIYKEDFAEMKENIKLATYTTEYAKNIDIETYNFIKKSFQYPGEHWSHKYFPYYSRTVGKDSGYGSHVDPEGKLSRSTEVSRKYGIRPAMWVKI